MADVHVLHTTDTAVTAFLQGSADTQAVLGGLSISTMQYPLVENLVI